MSVEVIFEIFIIYSFVQQKYWENIVLEGCKMDIVEGGFGQNKSR